MGIEETMARYLDIVRATAEKYGNPFAPSRLPPRVHVAGRIYSRASIARYVRWIRAYYGVNGPVKVEPRRRGKPLLVWVDTGRARREAERLRMAGEARAGGGPPSLLEEALDALARATPKELEACITEWRDTPLCRIVRVVLDLAITEYDGGLTLCDLVTGSVSKDYIRRVEEDRLALSTF